jgi:hypothetical protein
VRFSHHIGHDGPLEVAPERASDADVDREERYAHREVGEGNGDKGDRGDR